MPAFSAGVTIYMQKLIILTSMLAASLMVGCSSHKPKKPVFSNVSIVPVGGSTGSTNTDVLLLSMSSATTNKVDLVPDPTLVSPPKPTPIVDYPANALTVPQVRIPGPVTLTVNPDSDPVSGAYPALHGSLNITNRPKVWKINNLNQ